MDRDNNRSVYLYLEDTLRASRVLCVVLTCVVDLSKCEYIEEREDTAMGKVEPHESMGHRVSVHCHHLFQCRQYCTPLGLGGREMTSG